MKKRCIVWFIFVSFLFGFSFAYEPTTGDKEELIGLKTQVLSLSEGDNLLLWSFYEQARDLLKYVGEGKTKYILSHLSDYALAQFNTRKESDKLGSIVLKQEILKDSEMSGLNTADPLSETCYGWYNMLDNLSYAYNFPTALTIAVWYRESSCGYYLPKNGDGPFQIISKDYGSGAITKEIFEQTIKDFLEFSWNKINWYNSKNPSTPIRLDYQHFSYNDLYKFAGLYNGLSGGIIYGAISPANNKYFFEKMPGDYENGKKNGLFLEFLKVLEWELEQ